MEDEGFFEKEGYSTDRLTAALAAGRFRRGCTPAFIFIVCSLLCRSMIMSGRSLTACSGSCM